MRKSDFEYVVDLLKQQTGWELSNDKFFIIDRKVYKFVRENNYASTEKLVEELKTGNKTLIEKVVESLTMSDTSFFRDSDVFRNFEFSLIPHLRESNRGVKKLRIWSLGCSTGQETYSIAILLNRFFPKENDWEVEIIGTDLSSASIAKAQKGIYTNFEVQMGMNARTLLDNFRPVEDGWQINPGVMGLVKFRKYNALDEITFSEKFDVIFCRNLLRFFDAGHQKQIVNRIYSNQIREGFLYVGADESVEVLKEHYEPVKGINCLYQSKGKITPKFIPKRSEEADDVMPSFTRPGLVMK